MVEYYICDIYSLHNNIDIDLYKYNIIRSIQRTTFFLTYSKSLILISQPAV